jgi:hypothetical protein
MQFEMVFDDVKYSNDKKTANDLQVEVELKSDFIHRINLKMISDYFESTVSGISPTRKSKYKRGLELLQ